MTTWARIIQQIDADQRNLYELGQIMGTDYLSTELIADQIRQYHDELMDLQNRLINQLGLSLPDSATLVGTFYVQRIFRELVTAVPLNIDNNQIISVTLEPVFDDDFTKEWAIVIYNRQNVRQSIDVNMLSYGEIKSMTIEIKPKHKFWHGLAALLWEITSMGVETTFREQNIQQQQSFLNQKEQEMTTFLQTTRRISLFLDDYVRNHVDDPRLPDEVAYFWPLTTGKKQSLDAQNPNSPIITTMQLDNKLLNEFKLRFGRDFDYFWR